MTRSEHRDATSYAPLLADQGSRALPRERGGRHGEVTGPEAPSARLAGGRRDCILIVFARAPDPGVVKTRLIPLLGAEGAAALHAKLVKHTLATVRRAAFPRVELHGTPDIADPFLRFCAARYGVTLAAQVEGDLGARMLAAFEGALASCERVLLVGSDCPALTARTLRQAEGELREGADAVLVPCDDGGYALIGLRRTDKSLFEGLSWGSSEVMADTRSRLAALGWKWRELDTLWDVDRPEDYERLRGSDLLTGLASATTRSV